MLANLQQGGLRSAAAALLALCALPTLSSAALADSYAIKAGRVHVGGGQVLDDATVVIADGKIVSVLKAGAEVPAGVEVVEHDGDLSAGLIALQDFSGAQGENFDSTRTLMPDADLSYAFQPEHSDFERLLSEGITSIVLAPSRSSLVGGVTAVVKTHGGRVLKRRAHLELSLAASSLHHDRYPTSYAGALAEFDERLGSDEGAFADAQAGKLPVVIRADSKHEVQRAVAFARKHGLKGAIAGGSRSGELAASLRDAGLAVIYRPFTPGMETRSLRSVALLAEAQVPFGFGLEAPFRHPVSLRLAAAACMAAGLDAPAAWNALTVDAAKIAGVESSVGVVAAGKDADLVLWSAAPLDLGSSVVAVYVDGVRAFEGDH
ncbi:MAG: hypothetical protein ACI8QZ_002103 [Chlamydiales bacterium]|jgi:hypothetical protein